MSSAKVTPEVGYRNDAGKPKVTLVPRSFIYGTAEALAFGAEKYTRDNWLKGMAWSRVTDAALRHILAFNDGEDFDPESGLLHLKHAASNLAFLIEYFEKGLGEDDRLQRSSFISST